MKREKILLPALLLFCFAGSCMAGCGKIEADIPEVSSADDVETRKNSEEEALSEMISENGYEVDVLTDVAEAQSAIEGMIAEQSFNVELDDWGKVMFVSVAPEGTKGAPHFILVKDGKTVYTFPESAFPKSDEFMEVSAVSFADYNMDGKKDVIVLIRYQYGASAWSEAQVFLQENPDNMFYMDYPDNESYRIDAPTGNGPAFYRDSLLEEYLLTQRLTDTVSDVMGTWPDYIDYVDGLMGVYSVESQLEILAWTRDTWAADVEYADDRYCFTVADLDYDGILELIVSNQGGTGCYTYSRFYKVGGGGQLKELESSFKEGDSQPDIIEENGTDAQRTVYSDFGNFGMRDYYIVWDQIRTAPYCYVYRCSSLCIMDDFVLETPLAMQTYTYENDEDTPHIVSEDCNGNPLTEDEFWDFPDTYYGNMGLTKKTATFHWIDVSELTEKSDAEVVELLREAEQGFTR